MLLIQNCRMVDPASGVDGIRDILIEEGKIARISDTRLPVQEGMETIEAGGLIAAPGLVDVHVHFREPGGEHKETIATGARAAAAGGFTGIVLMANTTPRVDRVETLREIIEKGEATGIHIYTCANVTMGMQGKELTDMETLLLAGAVGFTDDGVPLVEEGIARAAMERAASLHAPISFHEENPAFIQNNGINHGKASAFYQVGGSDRQAEISMVERDLKIALETGASITIQHISTKEAVELVRQAKKRGSNIHAEAAPHHFTLTEEALIEHGTLAKMNPPLREEADRRAIIEGLKDGTIDLIATDHAPHAAEEKALPITEAPSGIIGLETSLALALEQLVEPGYLSLLTLIERMSLAPSRLYGLESGYLAEGGPADVVLFDPGERWIPTAFASKSQNSPFLNREMHGRVKLTLCGGRIVYDGLSASVKRQRRNG